MTRLTKRILEAAEPKARDYFIFDDELPGFGLRIMPSGRKIFVLQYRAGKKVRRCTLGHFPVLTVEQARVKATRTLANVREGRDPASEKKALAQIPLMRELAQRFLDTHCTNHLKPRTKERYVGLLDMYILPAMGHKRATDVTRADVANLHHEMAGQPVNANRALSVLSKLFNLSELWGIRPDGTNPCRHLQKYKELKRERYLTVNELRRLGETLRMAEETMLCSPYAIAAFRLLILTGARLSEIQFCRWEYVHLDRGIIRLPDSKTGPKFIHLGRAAIDLLRQLPRKNNPYLICSSHKPDEPIYDLQTTWQKIRKWAGIEDVRIHDLRHTFASKAVAMGMSLTMIGRLLGHTQTDTTGRYAHLALDPVLDAATTVANELGGLLALPPPADPSIIDVDALPAESSTPSPLALRFGVQSLNGLPVYMTPGQAASYLNVPPRRLEYWRYYRRGPGFVKVGNSVRYTRQALDDFVTSCPMS